MAKRKRRTPINPVLKQNAAVTGEQAAAMVGKFVGWRPPTRVGEANIEVACLVVNVRFTWGRWDLLVIPVVGDGVRTVQMHAVELDDRYGRMISLAGIEELQRRADECGSLLAPS